MRLETWSAPPGGRIPNHPSFAVLVYRGGDAAAAGAAAARGLFAEHGWGGSWVDGVFDFHHFHSTSHEVLAVIAGAATLELGGPQGRAFRAAAAARPLALRGLLARLEVERAGVDAPALAAGARAVVEDVAEVAAAAGAGDFVALHAVGVVGADGDEKGARHGTA